MGGFNNGTPGQTGLRNLVRYDTPTFAGFTGIAAWGEDDFWDVALNYRNDIGDFKVNGSLGYGESTDPVTNGAPQCLTTVGTGDCNWWGIGGLVQHIPTGLFVYGGYTVNEITLRPGQAGDDEARTFYVQAGIERKFNELGKTNIFGEYRNDDVGLTRSARGSDLDFYAVGVAQQIEKAELTLYTLYRHYEGDIVTGAGARNLDDFDEVISGGKINF
jgi:hypothetical protein